MNRNSRSRRRATAGAGFSKFTRLITAAMLVVAGVGVSDSVVASPDEVDAEVPTPVEWTVTSAGAPVAATQWLLTDGEVTLAVRDNGTANDLVEPGVAAVADDDPTVGALEIATLRPGSWELALAVAPADVVIATEPHRFTVTSGQEVVDLGTIVLAAAPVAAPPVAAAPADAGAPQPLELATAPDEAGFEIAAADDGKLPLLTLTKTVAPLSSLADPLNPGETFTYTISVGCNQVSCINAAITDPLPAELDGFLIAGVDVNHTGGGTAPTVTWNGSSTMPATVVTPTELVVTPQQTFGADKGIIVGQGVTVTLTLQVPTGLSPSWPHNDDTIRNTATATADNSLPVARSADVVVHVEQNIAVGVTKAWTPSSAQLNPGAASTIKLGVTNASNVPVDRLVLQEPRTAPDGATTLDASNPFRITDFTAFANTSLPAGATAVTTEVYVWDATLATPAYVWKSGAPGSAPALPAGVVAADVAGVRLTYTGTIAVGATASVDLNLAQRSTFRGSSTAITAGTRVDNRVTGTAEKTGLPPASKDAPASHSLTAVPTGGNITKDITPSTVVAGLSSTATITARNTASTGAASLTISDRDYFVQNQVMFGGFPSAPVPPSTTAGATLTGSITWVGFGSPAPTQTVAFTPGNTPALPTGWTNAHVSGFDIVWTATTGTGSITTTASTVVFDIDTSRTAATTPNPNPRDTTNTAGLHVAYPQGQTVDRTATDTLRITAPTFDVGLNKRVTPTHEVRAGDLVTVMLEPSISASAQYITPTKLVVDDVLGAGTNEFWNAFNLYSIAPTSVPAGSTLAIDVHRADGTWTSIGTWTAGATGLSVSLTNAALATAAGVDPATLTGVRFTYTNALGIENTVRPNLVFQARDTIRGTSTPTAVAGGPASIYVNTATADGEAKDDAGKDYTDHAVDTGQASIKRPAGGGPGVGDGYSVAKQWQDLSGNLTTALGALSGQRAQTSLQWRVSAGNPSVTLQDHSNITGVSAQTVYDAFNLVQVRSITGAQAESLKWDKITAIEIWNGTEWKAPANCPVPASGNYVTLTPSTGAPTSASFAGCTLTAAEQLSTTAFRITVAENAETRAAAAAAGVANAPAVGSGVVTGPREFRLVWELRNTLRSNSATFITKDTIMNAGGAGVIRNTVRMTPLGKQPVEASADISVVNGTPGAAITKTASPTNVTMPAEGTPGTGYPAVTFTSTARNTGPVLAQYLRISDPQTCAGIATSCAVDGTVAGATGNPYATMPAGGWLTMTGAATASPFDSFTITKVTASASQAGQVDYGASTVWLLRYTGTNPASAASYTSESTTVTALNAMTDVQLANVVGVTVTFQPTNPAVTGGTIAPNNNLKLVIETRLRDTVRSTAQPLTVLPNTTVDVTNTATTQVWDTILNDGLKYAAGANAKVTITGQTIDVTPGKAITPASILAVNRHVPVTVTLSGTSAASTLPPKTVWLRDDVTTSPDFWATFEFTGLATPLVAPSGADRVQIDLRVDQADPLADPWVVGVPQTLVSPALPTLPAGATLADVNGIRVTFSKLDGTHMATTWTTSVPLSFALRDSYEFPPSGTKTVDNEMSIQSVRDLDVQDSPQNSLVKNADAEIDLTAGSFAIAVLKESTSDDFPTRLAEVGLARPWTLQFKNTGTGVLEIPSLVDDLGVNLVPGNPINLTYATTPGGTLATDGVTHDYDDVNDRITFTWPTDGRLMQPGEVFTITLDLVLQPGLATGQKASNQMVVNTVQNLSSCTNINPDYVNNPDMGVIHDPDEPTSCGTRNFVQPSASLNLYVEKAVSGYRGTAATTGGAACAATVQGLNGRSYFPSPCLSDTLYSTDTSIVDQWLLRTSNTTTQAVTRLVVFDDLPVSGDKLLIGGAGRGSDYRTVLTGAPAVAASGGVTITGTTTEVTFDVDACQGTWTHLNANPGAVPCAQNGATWVAASAGTDWSKVAGIRVTLEFDPQAPLSMGKTLDVSFATLNVIESAPATGLSGTVPIDQQEAWNQFGIQWQFQNGTYSQRIPSVVGVTPIAGPLQIDKVVTGDAADYAPDSFDFDVMCTIAQPGAEEPTVLTLPNGGKVTVTRGEDGIYEPAVIDGIPVGATCTVIEQGDVGEFGETSREVSPEGPIAITEPAGPDGEVPEGQIVTVTNTFDFSGGIEVTKRVETDAVAGEFGPFEFALECTTSDGTAVIFGGDEESTTLEFTLLDGETFVVDDDVIPVGSTCTLTEVTSANANDITFDGAPDLEDNGVEDNGDGSATVQVGADVAIVTVTNHFDVGTLTIVKNVTGAGAQLYGSGPFTFNAVCTFGTQKLLDSNFNVAPGTPKVVGPYPAGTNCVVTEVGAGGANSSVLDPANGHVAIRSGEGSSGNVTVTATNTFDVGSVVVTKALVGVTGAVGPFTVELACTRDVNGAAVPIIIPGGAQRILSNPDALTATYADLPARANCTLTETSTAGAIGTSVSVTIGTDTVVSPGTAARFVVPSQSTAVVRATITNTFDQDSGIPNPPGPPGGGGGGGGGLPSTGGEVGRLLTLAAAALGVGVLLLVSRRRRHPLS